MSLRKSPELTPALVAANRRNAQQSTGPRTRSGKARARLNGLRHGRRSPLFASFQSALRENLYNVRAATKRLLQREDARHPLFAYWIREWGRVWTRNHAYMLTGMRKLKRLERLLRPLRAGHSREAATGDGSEGSPLRPNNSERLGERDRRGFVPKKVKTATKGIPPAPKNTSEAGMLLKVKGMQKWPLCAPTDRDRNRRSFVE